MKPERYPLLLVSALLLIGSQVQPLSAADQYQGLGYGGYGGFRPLTPDEIKSQGRATQGTLPTQPIQVPQQQPYCLVERGNRGYPETQPMAPTMPMSTQGGTAGPSTFGSPRFAPLPSQGGRGSTSTNYPEPQAMPLLPPPGIAQQGYKFRRVPGDSPQREQKPEFTPPGNPGQIWGQVPRNTYGQMPPPQPVFRPLEQKNKRGREARPLPAWSQTPGYPAHTQQPYGTPEPPMGFRPDNYR